MVGFRWYYYRDIFVSPISFKWPWKLLLDKYYLFHIATRWCIQPGWLQMPIINKRFVSKNSSMHDRHTGNRFAETTDWNIENCTNKVTHSPGCQVETDKEMLHFKDWWNWLLCGVQVLLVSKDQQEFCCQFPEIKTADISSFNLISCQSKNAVNKV